LADGRRLLDGISSWWSILHGHAHPKIVEAIAQQAAKLDHVLFAGCTHEPAVRLAEGLVDLAQALGDKDSKKLSRVFYSDNGATSVEVALKAAFQTWMRRGEEKRRLFIALEGSYHGDTVGAMSVSDPAPFFREFHPLLFQVIRIPPNAEMLAHVLQEHEGEVAGLIVEPLVQGATGMVMHSPDFLRAARKWCDVHDVLMIADEVATGFGRTGTVFACEQAGISPDLMCLAKGLSGGVLPLAATLVTEEIYEAFLSDDRAKTFFHGHTFTANPIACAAGVASLEILKEEKTPDLLAAIGERLEDALREVAGEPWVKDLRRLGGIVAVELESSNAGYHSNLGEKLRQLIAEHPVLLRPSGNVLYALTPSCLSDEEVDLLGRAMVDIVRRVGDGSS